MEVVVVQSDCFIAVFLSGIILTMIVFSKEKLKEPHEIVHGLFK